MEGYRSHCEVYKNELDKCEPLEDCNQDNNTITHHVFNAGGCYSTTYTADTECETY